ncbi:BTAD domain-containing putative transcriptional regulator [Kitasatospora sp. NPDC127111]|uniref:AfsR/SARP family transcriptional regulator n=1 Tax=Kitasatospora sp. NPDC127111 TaxID=3345363 RepID=UPI00364184A0
MTVHDGAEERLVSGSRLRSLLAVLLLHANQPLSTDRLQDILWHGIPPASGTAAVRNLVARLRHALADDTATRLAATPLGYRLHVAAGELDGQVFDRHIELARAALSAENWNSVNRETSAALALWRGIPLAELPELDEAHAPRQRWQEARLQALEWRLEARIRLGGCAGVVPELTQLVDEHPLREKLHHLLIRALHEEGHRAQALTAYQHLRATLRDELGIEPSPTARMLHQDVLRSGTSPDPHPAHDRAPSQAIGRPTATGLMPARTPTGSRTKPASAGAAPYQSRTMRWTAQLPADTADFTGRTHELTILVDRLRAAADDGTACTTAVTGMGGIGKTALAVHAAHQVKTHFPDGQLYVDLRGFGTSAPRTAHDVLAGLLTLLLPDRQGRPLPDDTGDRAALLRGALAGRRVLLVLDNARDAAQVLPLLPGQGNCAAIVTSRNTLAAVPGALQVRLEPLDVDEQRSLLAASCGQERVGADPDGALRVLAACAGLPLALRIAAARLAARPSWSLSVLAQQMEGSRRLGSLTVGHLGVRASLTPSYLALRDSPQPVERETARVFRLLGLWPGVAFGVQSASAVANLPTAETEDILELLVDFQLLQSPEPLRYRFHDLVAEFAAERAQDEEPADSRDAARTRLMVWYATALQAASAAMAPGQRNSTPVVEAPPAPIPAFDGHEQALTWCTREYTHIAEAIRQAASSTRPDLAWRIAAQLAGHASSHWWTGDAENCMHLALAIARKHGDRIGQTRMLETIGTCQRRAGQWEQAQASLGTALAIAEEHDADTVTSVLWQLASLHETRPGSAAVEYASRAFAREQVTRTPDEPMMHSTMGSALLNAADFRGAEFHLRQGLALWRRHGNLNNIATVLSRLGETLAGLDRREDALTALHEATTIQQRVGNVACTADCLIVTARVHLRFDALEEARTCCQQALDIASQHDLQDLIQRALEGLAHIDGHDRETVPGVTHS